MLKHLLRRAAIALVLVTGCATGRFGAPQATRPLTMPSGEHQIVLAGGALLDTEPFDYERFAFRVEYRYGVTDHIEVVAPLRVRYRFGDADGLQLALGTGLYGIGFGIGPVRARNGDPRAPNAEDTFFVWETGVTAMLKAPFGSDLAIVTGLKGTTAFLGERPSVLGLTPMVLLQIELGEYVSLSPSISGAFVHVLDDGRSDFALNFLGSGTNGASTVPTISVHVSDQVDIFAVLGVAYQPADGDVFLQGLIGVDWHFANPGAK